MDGSIHHSPNEGAVRGVDVSPNPDPEPARWKEAIALAMGEDATARWGKQLLRITNDMVVICNEELQIVYHNRGFLRSIGHFEGSYLNQSFLDFFPAADRADAAQAFRLLLSSQHGGLRFGATMLTKRGKRAFDARAVRSRRTNGEYLLYMIIREEQKVKTDIQKTERKASELLFAGLPVAAFRTDKRLRILRAFGSLWDELKINPSSLKGADLCDPQCHLVPKFLHQIDYCDTMAGLTLHADLTWREVPYEVTVEPFLDKNRKVVGTIGMLRKAKTDPVDRGTEHLSIPMPVDPTTPLKRSLTVEITSGGSPRFPGAGAEMESPAALADMGISEEAVSQIRGEIKPRPLAPPDIGVGPTTDTERVALAN